MSVQVISNLQELAELMVKNDNELADKYNDMLDYQRNTYNITLIMTVLMLVVCVTLIADCIKIYCTNNTKGFIYFDDDDDEKDSRYTEL